MMMKPKDLLDYEPNPAMEDKLDEIDYEPSPAVDDKAIP
jgi:hypothetical protein